MDLSKNKYRKNPKISIEPELFILAMKLRIFSWKKFVTNNTQHP